MALSGQETVHCRRRRRLGNAVTGASTVRWKRRNETGHRPVEQNSQPPASREENEHGGKPENHRAEPGMRYPLTKAPEEDKVQGRGQKQAACESFDQRCGEPK